jgi:hypothetical protein
VNRLDTVLANSVEVDEAPRDELRAKVASVLDDLDSPRVFDEVLSVVLSVEVEARYDQWSLDGKVVRAQSAAFETVRRQAEETGARLAAAEETIRALRSRLPPRMVPVEVWSDEKFVFRVVEDEHYRKLLEIQTTGEESESGDAFATSTLDFAQANALADGICAVLDGLSVSGGGSKP